jgi:pimeloyl-ACP methyl ester carboxylesterase
MKLTKLLALNYIRLKFRVLSLMSVRKTAVAAFRLFCTPLEKSKKQTPPVFKFAEPIYELFNGHKLKGYRWNKGQPTKILILHGFASAAHKFHRYVLPLIEKGYEVIAFDAPAHGSSGGDTINALEYKLMIKKVLENHGPVQGFISHSFGGLALSLALEETAHDASTKVVLIAPATETTTAIDNAFKLLGISNKKVRAEFNRLIEEISGQKPEWFSINRAMNNINAKVLWIHDEYDDTTPLIDALKTKDQRLPNVEFVVTRGLGHSRIYSDEEVMNRIIDFL